MDDSLLKHRPKRSKGRFWEQIKRVAVMTRKDKEHCPGSLLKGPDSRGRRFSSACESLKIGISSCQLGGF